MAFDRLATFIYTAETASGQRDVFTRIYAQAGTPGNAPPNNFYFVEVTTDGRVSPDTFGKLAAFPIDNRPFMECSPFDSADRDQSGALVANFPAGSHVIMGTRTSAGIVTVYFSTFAQQGYSSATESFPIDHQSFKLVADESTLATLQHGTPLAGTEWQMYGVGELEYREGLPYEFPVPIADYPAWCEVVNLGAASLVQTGTGADFRQRQATIRTPYLDPLLSADRFDLDGEVYTITDLEEVGLRRMLEFTGTVVTEEVRDAS